MPNCTVAMLLMGMRLKTGRSAECGGRLKQCVGRSAVCTIIESHVFGILAI